MNCAYCGAFAIVAGIYASRCLCKSEGGRRKEGNHDHAISAPGTGESSIPISKISMQTTPHAHLRLLISAAVQSSNGVLHVYPGLSPMGDVDMTLR